MCSWHGLDNFDSIAKIVSDNKERNTIGLFVICGSWNRPNPETLHATTIKDLLSQILSTDGMIHSNHHYITGILQADGSEDGLSTCVGDDGCLQDFSCPPEKLPALLFVGKRPSMPQPETRYLKSLSSEDLLSFWRGTSDNMESSICLDPVRREVQDRLLFLGLGRTTTTTIASDETMQQEESSSLSAEAATRIFIAGDRMSVGKTSVCLGLIGSFLQSGIPPESLAYIKPATQNESPQLVQRYCERFGIDCIPIGPVVYYRGFTRAFLAGDTEPTSELLARVQETVDRLAEGKQIVIIDGVGFPAVGSICGTDNASVARASGYPDPGGGGGRRIPPGVLLVGGSGVGGAVDAFNLNATYFEAANVPVLGAIFNKLRLEGFYSLENCKQQITSYFAQNEHQQRLHRQPFGFVPLYPGLATKGSDDALEAANEYIRIFHQHVDISAILASAAKVKHQTFPMPMASEDAPMTDSSPSSSLPNTTTAPPAPKRHKTTQTKNATTRSRQEIEQAAIQAGAAPSA